MRFLIFFYLCFLLGEFSFGQPASLSLNTYNGQSSITALDKIVLLDGFHIPIGSNVVISLQNAPNISVLPSNNHNYVLTRRFKVSGVNSQNINNLRKIGDENQSISYYDGIGRLIQSVELMASPNFKDVIQHVEYDRYNRTSRVFLPYIGASQGDGAYRIGGAANVVSFYNGNSEIANGTKYPFSETVFETGPLERVKEQGFSGADWQISSTDIVNSGHNVRTEYGLNSSAGLESVRKWKVTSTGADGTTVYPSSSLSKTTFYDENNISKSKGGSVDEYKDDRQRIVLKRIWKNASEKLDTYYVYDYLGDLRYVIPPGYKDSLLNNSSADFQELVYAYNYDSRGRITEKKVPGKGWEWFVYNGNNQLILTQDAVQRTKQPKNEWNFIKYDVLGRIVQKGKYYASFSTQSGAQAVANSVNIMFEERSVITKMTGVKKYTKYTNSAYPNVSEDQLFQVNYYDDYMYDGADLASLAPLHVTNSNNVKGMPTGSIIWKEDRSDSMRGVNYYDDYDHIIQNVAQNHLGGVDRETNEYNFAGELIKSTRVHTPSSGIATTIITTNEYDHSGRQVQTKKKINNQPEVIQSKLSYNEMGQLSSKSLHSENGGANFLTTINYQYNERGWLSKQTSPQFSSQLNYHSSGTALLANAQYNGNIAQQLWGHSSATNSVFTYNYDALNRLISGVSTGTVLKEVLTYDDMGNVKTLSRDNGNTIAYIYNNGNKSNRLASLSGGLTGTFTYDVNGNSTKDRTGMVFKYNQLNLPQNVTGGGRIVEYSYEATGTKLSRTLTVGSNVNRQDYIKGIEYNKVGSDPAVIERIATEDGFLLNSSGSYSYYYNLMDHQGNVRVVLKKDGTAAAPLAAVMQKLDYYPFGKTKSISTSINNKYLYNGKEMQYDLNLGTHNMGSSYVLDGQYDYGARFYDAEIGRWNVVDPLADNYVSYSPYNYTINNPIRFIDPDGRYFKEYNSIEDYYADNPNGKLDGNDGHWLKSDREEENSRWSNANVANLEHPNGYKEYNTISQRRDFYKWFQNETRKKGFETYWAGAAYIVASQMSLVETLLGNAFSPNEVLAFAQAGNKAIFNDVFNNLANLYFGPVLKGEAAMKWDIKTLRHEQRDVVDPLYASQSKTTITNLSNMAKLNDRYFFSPILGNSPRLRFEGDISNWKDRYKHGMNKVVPFYKKYGSIQNSAPTMYNSFSKPEAIKW